MPPRSTHLAFFQCCPNPRPGLWQRFSLAECPWTLASLPNEPAKGLRASRKCYACLLVFSAVACQWMNHKKRLSGLDQDLSHIGMSRHGLKIFFPCQNISTTNKQLKSFKRVSVRHCGQLLAVARSKAESNETRNIQRPLLHPCTREQRSEPVECAPSQW